ncbi:MAG: DUF2974 domain-containing protein, partial [Oscillospiraceae bacterium]|nr:DUF2974 domain-containing protein [Oscillospiraceae bacterium]
MVTDKGNQLASRIAYSDLDKIMDYSSNKIVSFEELNRIINSGDVDTSELNLGGFNSITKSEEEWEVAKDWKFVDYHRDDPSGFYGYAIDTGNELIIGFRGTEFKDDFWKDFVGADAGLAFTIETKQQSQVENFLNQINNSDYIENYDNVYVTGHSLGGNLAMHSTFESQKYNNINVVRCVTFDAPGFGDKYFIFHDTSNADIITAYQYSGVGYLMYPIPKANYISIEVNEEKSVLFAEHPISNVKTDKYGFVIGENLDECQDDGVIFRGTNGKDEILGNDKDNAILGYSGDDTLKGLGGNDYIYGYEGYDTIDGGEGVDIIYGDSGNDEINGGENNDKIYGDEGNDTLIGNVGDDVFYGGIGEDTIFGDDKSDGYDESNNTTFDV